MHKMEKAHLPWLDQLGSCIGLPKPLDRLRAASLSMWRRTASIPAHYIISRHQACVIRYRGPRQL